MLFIYSFFFVMIFPIPYFVPKSFCLVRIRLLVCLRLYTLNMLVEFSFVVLESLVMSVLFGPVFVSFWSSFFRQYFLISCYELYFSFQAEILEKSVSWVPASEEEGWLSLARRSFAAGVARGGGGAYGKVVIERLCLCLPYVEKPFNSKVIKSFVPELRSRKYFLVFQDSYVIYVRYGHNEGFAYRYEYVHFPYSCMAM